MSQTDSKWKSAEILSDWRVHYDTYIGSNPRVAHNALDTSSITGLTPPVPAPTTPSLSVSTSLLLPPSLPPVLSLCLSACLSVGLFLCLSLSLPVSRSLSLCVYLSLCLCLSVSVSVSLCAENLDLHFVLLSLHFSSVCKLQKLDIVMVPVSVLVSFYHNFYFALPSVAINQGQIRKKADFV